MDPKGWFISVAFLVSPGMGYRTPRVYRTTLALAPAQSVPQKLQPTPAALQRDFAPCMQNFTVTYENARANVFKRFSFEELDHVVISTASSPLGTPLASRLDLRWPAVSICVHGLRGLHPNAPL